MKQLTESFEAFVERNKSIMMKFAISRSQSIEDAEEIVNEAYLRIWKVWLERVKKTEDENKKWMFAAIAYIVMEYRKNCTEPPHEELAAGEDVGEADENIEQITEDSQFGAYLTKIKATLGEEEWLIVDKIMLHGMSYDEFSKRYGLKSATLRSRISRLRKKLKPYFSKFL